MLNHLSNGKLREETVLPLQRILMELHRHIEITTTTKGAVNFGKPKNLHKVQGSFCTLSMFQNNALFVMQVKVTSIDNCFMRKV